MSQNIGSQADPAVTDATAAATVTAALKGLLSLFDSGAAVKPFTPLIETAVGELVGINEQIDQNDYSAAFRVSLAATMSGEILMVTLYSTEDGSGAVQQPDGVLIFFDSDPGITSGDTTIAASKRLAVIGQIDVETADWQADSLGASACIKTQPVAFHAVGDIYAAWFHEHATSLNSAAGDDEQLEFNMWIRRDS